MTPREAEHAFQAMRDEFADSLNRIDAQYRMQLEELYEMLRVAHRHNADLLWLSADIAGDDVDKLRALGALLSLHRFESLPCEGHA